MNTETLISATKNTDDDITNNSAHLVVPGQNYQQITTRISTRNFTMMPSRKRRIKIFAVLTTMTTTLWWWQTIVLLQFLPHAAAEAATGGGRIILPPPPPRPSTPAKETSSETASIREDQTKLKSSQRHISEVKSPPPPPPPRVISNKITDKTYQTSKNLGAVEKNDSSNADIYNALVKSNSDAAKSNGEEENPAATLRRPPLPPPPPSQTHTETKEMASVEEKKAAPLRASGNLEGKPSSTITEMKSETLRAPPREQHPQGLYQYVQQNQSPQWQQQNIYQQQNSFQRHHYPNQQYQSITRRGAVQGHMLSQQSASSNSNLSSTLKGLWRKVERGLDDLAGIEDSVAEGAQKLATRALSTASTASKYSPLKLRSLVESGATAAASGAKAASSMMNRSRSRAPIVSYGTSEPLRPYGEKYNIARRQREEKNHQFQTNANGNGSSSNKRVHELLRSADKSKSIAAKGGATSGTYGSHPQGTPSSVSSLPSSPRDDNIGREDTHDDPNHTKSQLEMRTKTDPTNSHRATWNLPSPPTDLERERQNQQGENQTYQRGSSNGSNGPSTGNPDWSHGPGDSRAINRGPPHDSTLQQPQRETQSDPRDPHSRDNRIPWDTAPSSSNLQTPPSSPHQGPQPEKNRPDYRYEDRDTSSWKRALKGISLPPLPSFRKLSMPRFRRRHNAFSYGNLDAWDAADKEESGKSGGFFGFFKRSSAVSSSSSFTLNSSSRDSNQVGKNGQPPLVTSMLSRCNNGKSTSLLSGQDEKASKMIGRYEAILDTLFLLSVLLGFKLLSSGFDSLTSLPSSWTEVLETVLPKVGSALNELFEGSWALFAFLYASLFKYFRDGVLNSKVDRLASRVASSVKEESEYIQLYLRLLAATPMDRNLPDRIAKVAKTQVASLVAKARLNSFVGIVLASLTVMTVSEVGPIAVAIGSAITKIALLEEWRQWPLPWEGLFGAASAVMQNLWHVLESHGAGLFRSFLDNPIQFSFHLSMFASFLLCAVLPNLEERRATSEATKTSGQDPDEDAITTLNLDSAEEWSRLGTSSASRLSMLSENGSVENALARWRASHITQLDEPLANSSSLSRMLRLGVYAVAVVFLAGSPLLVSHFLAGETPSLTKSFSIFRWDSLFDLSFLQYFFIGLMYHTFQKVVESLNDISAVKKFQSELVSTKEEIEESNNSNANFQVMGSVSPSAGIAVRDLWAAHATKRAWAIRGANLQCKNGEILAVLGEDGNGKTRLLTTLAEALTNPPKRIATTNKVRGLIAIGGLDVTKWNPKILKRRVGIFLSDVRMVADSASLFSGWTMEEILEPVDALRSVNSDSLQRTYTKAEKSAMLSALKVCIKIFLNILPHKLIMLDSNCDSLFS